MTDARSPSAAFRPWPDLAVLAGFLLLCYGAAFLGQIATGPAIPTWYAGLAKPPLNPPNAVFPVVWTALYTLMAVAAWLVWQVRTAPMRGAALAAFLVQLALNVAWSFAFFGERSPGLGLVVVVPLLAAIAVTTWLFGRVRPLAGRLMVPYLLWVSFATYLNAGVFALN
ncbi:MAG TPA: tryptophan-rich sensory protein [Bauldia sp.]|nr:tryptophan-rich sensory protein [Bauldia sp.]